MGLFVSSSMNLPLVNHTNSTYTNPKTNPFWLVPLVIFTIVSVAPHNALAFEANLPYSPVPKLIAQVRIERENLPLPILEKPLAASHSTLAVRANATPITEEGNWPKPVTRVAAVAPVITAPLPEIVANNADTVLVLEGEASYYSRAGCLGCSPNLTMANGQPLNDNALTMAIGADKKHLVGRQARVTSLATGKSVVVRITDTGGFYKAKYGNRVADLTIATKQAIGMAGGVGQVRVEVF